MGKKYICEVVKDHDNYSLELVNVKKYNLSTESTPGSIKFSDKDDFHHYFNNNCISEDNLNNNGSIFTYLFWLLLFILLIMLVAQLVMNGSKKVATDMGTVAKFGRFNF